MKNKTITIIVFGVFLLTAIVVYAASPGAVTVTYPNGGEVLTAGAEITWANTTDADGDVVKYLLYYSSNSGSTWNSIISNYGAETNVNSSSAINATFTSNSNQTLFFTLPKIANISYAVFNITPFQYDNGYGTYYTSSANEPGTDGADSDGNVGCFGAWQTTLKYESKILVTADVGATITNVSLNAYDYTSNNAFSHLTYNITICQTNVTNFTSTGLNTADTNCNTTVSLLLDQIWNTTFASMTGSGNNRWFTFNLQYPFTMVAGADYIIHFKYISGADASKTNRFKCRYDTATAVNANRSCYGTTSGCTIQKNQIQNTKLYAVNLTSPSNVFIDVGTTDGNYEFNQTGDYSTTNQTVDVKSQIQDNLNSCSSANSQNCSVPILLHSDTNGHLQINAVDIRYTDYWWDVSSLAAGTQYRINVTPTDLSTNGTSDISNADFTINAPPSGSNINKNTTLSGTLALFYAYWTDDAMSGYIFSTNNSGSWSNDSFVALTGATGWSNVTKTLNSVVLTPIGWMTYINDTYGAWNSTGLQNFTTTAPPGVVKDNPNAGWVRSDQTAACYVTDYSNGLGISSVQARWYNESDGIASSWTSLTNGGGTYWSGTLAISNAQDGQNYTIQFNATDNAGVSNVTTNVTSMGVDKTNPSVASINSPASNRNISSSYLINYTMTDSFSGSRDGNIHLENATGNFSPTGVVELPGMWGTTFSKFGDTNYYNLTMATTSLVDGTYQIGVLVYDNAWNSQYNRTRTITIDNTKPQWQSQSQSSSTPIVGASVTLSAQGLDATSGLSYAILETNESGTYSNTTSYSSPSNMNGVVNSWTTATFTWQNSSSVAGAIIGWRIWFNDSVGNYNVTNYLVFTMQPECRNDLDCPSDYECISNSCKKKKGPDKGGFGGGSIFPEDGDDTYLQKPRPAWRELKPSDNAKEENIGGENQQNEENSEGSGGITGAGVKLQKMIYSPWAYVIIVIFITLIIIASIKKRRKKVFRYKYKSKV